MAKYQNSPSHLGSRHFRGSEMPSIKNLITDTYGIREAKIAQSVMQRSK